MTRTIKERKRIYSADIEEELTDYLTGEELTLVQDGVNCWLRLVGDFDPPNGIADKIRKKIREAIRAGIEDLNISLSWNRMGYTDQSNIVVGKDRHHEY